MTLVTAAGVIMPQPAGQTFVTANPVLFTPNDVSTIGTTTVNGLGSGNGAVISGGAGGSGGVGGSGGAGGAAGAGGQAATLRLSRKAARAVQRSTTA